MEEKLLLHSSYEMYQQDDSNETEEDQPQREKFVRLFFFSKFFQSI